MCTRLLGAFAPFAVRQRDLSRDGSLSQRGLRAAQASVNPRFQHPAPVLSSFFHDLAHAVVYTILAPLNSQHMRPNLPPRVFTAEFWHAHFNYAALRTDPALVAIGSMFHRLWVLLSCLTIRTTRTSNPLQHPLPTPLLFSLFNKTSNFHCRRFLVTRTSFCLSLDCLHQKVTSVRRLSHFSVIPTNK